MRLRFNRFQLLVHLGSLLPLALLITAALLDNLTVNPIQAVEQRTGQYAIIWLLLSLSCTPLATLGFSPALQVRRALGLYAFFYALLHFFTFAVLDYNLDINLVLADFGQKSFILVGLTGLLLLIPLAVTSTQGWMKRLGKRWKQLHRLIYVVGVVVVVHYILAVKADIGQPLIYGAVLVVLLIMRLPAVRLRLKTQRPGWLSSVNRFLTRSLT